MRLAARRARPGSDAGFTLIELLVVIVVIGLITAPLADLIITFSRNADVSADRLALSHDAQIAAAYVARDVASVGMRDYTASYSGTNPLPFKPSVERAAAYNASGHTCGSATTPVAAVRLLSDDWDTSTNPATLRTGIVAYFVVTAGSRHELHRIKCVGGPVPLPEVTLAHNVDPATLTVNCSSTCESATVPQSVTVAFSVSTPRVPAYSITLTGQRRQT
jgi:prepilin-type N-terminal cleavage/methylation domain-containing protein